MPRDERLAKSLEDRLISHDPMVGELESGDEQTKAEDIRVPVRQSHKPSKSAEAPKAKAKSAKSDENSNA